MLQKIAYFDASHECPEELIAAAGFTPYKILGDVHQSNEPADQYLNNFVCPAARSFLTDALAHSKDWAGIVFAHGCDATNRHFDIWKMHVQTPFLYWFNSPMNLDDLAAKFEKKEMSRFIAHLEKQFNVKISTEKIQTAIAESNEVKLLLQQLGALRASKDIANVDYFHICVKAVQLPKAELIPLLKQTLTDWQKKPPFPANKKKILLTGSDITYKEWMMILDEANLRVVRDDLSIGERYYMTTIPQKADPLDALVEYYFNIPRAANRNPPDPRFAYLLSAMKSNGLQGLVSQNLKFCEPYAFDSVYLMNFMKQNGFQAIHLEREFAPSIDQQLLNRLEAFKEML
jgi:benzoyl-CoA reductase/2-hydroxyglutaryl-CoA dehydratase subunit BcrC/BadD/HgdB